MFTLIIKAVNIMLILAGFVLLASGVSEIIGGVREKSKNKAVQAIPGFMVGLILTMMFLSNIF